MNPTNTIPQVGHGKCNISHSHVHPRRAHQILIYPPDPLHNRPNAHNRHHQNGRLLRAQAEMERHARVCPGHLAHPHAVGLLRLRHRALRHPRPVWRLLRYDCGFRGEYSRRWAVHCQGVGDG